MADKPVNPYVALRDRCSEWARKVIYPRTLTMFVYPAEKLSSTWRLDDVKERVAAANTLGYDVCIVIRDNGSLEMQYRKRPGNPPYEVMP